MFLFYQNQKRQKHHSRTLKHNIEGWGTLFSCHLHSFLVCPVLKYSVLPQTSFECPFCDRYCGQNIGTSVATVHPKETHTPTSAKAVITWVKMCHIWWKLEQRIMTFREPANKERESELVSKRKRRLICLLGRNKISISINEMKRAIQKERDLEQKLRMRKSTEWLGSHWLCYRVTHLDNTDIKLQKWNSAKRYCS